MGRMVSLCRLRCENDVTVREPGGGSQYRSKEQVQEAAQPLRLRRFDVSHRSPCCKKRSNHFMQGKNAAVSGAGKTENKCLKKILQSGFNCGRI